MRLFYETDRLYLKILRGDHAPEVLRFYMDNKDIFEQYEPKRPDNFYTEAYQRSLLNIEFNTAIKLSAIRFWVFQKNDPDRIIGTVCFHDIMHSVYSSCELGYKFDQRYWHNGYATETLDFCVDLIFSELNLHRIEARVMPSNTASCQLLERLRFVREGLSRKSIRINGKWQDHYAYSLLAEERDFYYL